MRRVNGVSLGEESEQRASLHLAKTPSLGLASWASLALPASCSPESYSPQGPAATSN